MPRLRLGILALTLLFVGVVHATELPPVDVSITPFVELPQVGQPITLSFELTSEIAGTVTDVGFVSESPNPTEPDPDYYWDIIGHTAPANIPLLPQQPAGFEMTMDCNDPSEPIRIQFKFDGQWIRRDFFLLPLGANDLYQDTTLKTIPGSKVGPVSRNLSLAIPALSPNRRTDIVDVSKDQSGGKAALRLYGQIAYRREDFLRAGADGISVRAYDRGGAGVPDFYLGGQVTDSEGYFDFTVNSGALPDLYLEVEMSSNIADVIYPSLALDPYLFTTPTDYNWSSSERDYGTLSTTEASLAPALHILTTLTRAWRLAADSGFGSISKVDAWWPSGDNASYTRYLRLIHISTKRMWDEFAIGHEFGHHFNYEFGAHLTVEYCNPGDYADSDDDCTHRAWCSENDGVAWSEGFANWYGSALRIEIEAAFGTTITEESLEALEGCPENGDVIGPFEITEGLLAAFCLDLSDSNNEEDPEAYDNGKDRLDWDNATILHIVDDYEPVTAVGFVNAVLAKYPGDRKLIWGTAANNRYNFDHTPPPGVAALYSTSHQTSGDSPDATVDLWWNGVIDDTSGIDFYRIYSADNPNFTGLNVSSDDDYTVGTWTSPTLQPGDYWFRIYVHDKAGNISSTAADFGPVTIRAATPPDLLPSHGTWPEPVLVKGYTGAPFEISPFLFGNIATTYYSMSVGNGGELDATGTQTHRLYVDGTLVAWFSTTDLASYGQQSVVDVGPDNVRGGRHNLSFIADADEQRSEPDEDNNWYSKQYIWSGMGLNASWRVRGNAPDAWGGFKATTIFSSPNCDGFSYATQTGVFRGVVLKPAGNVEDYGDHDLRSFPISTGATNGFSTLSAYAISSRPLGCLDAIITMNDLTTGTLFNAGVYNFTDTHATFAIRRIESVPINDQVETPISIAAGDYLNLYHATLVGGAPGGDFGAVRVSSDPADGVLHAAVFDMATTHVGLDDPLATGQSDEFGEIRFEFAQINGRHVVAVWQDPKDAQVPAVSIAANLWIGTAPPDLVPTVAAGWVAPVSPTDGAPGLPGAVGWPTQLQGNTASTYFNFAIRNVGLTTAANFDKYVYLDGTGVTGTQISQLGAFNTHVTNYATAYTVQSGRHTLSGMADDGFAVSERSETNNSFGQQWVWSPFQLGNPSGWITRPAPPDGSGGWDHLLSNPVANPAGPPVYFNCDGLRTPMPGITGDDGWWQAVAIMAQGSADYDVRLHEMDTSVDAGFKGIRESSVWAERGVDYVLVNFRNTQARQFDVGVVRVHGSKNYYAQVVVSQFLGNSPTGLYGSFVLADDALMNLHEMYLEAGPITIRTLNAAGTVDWGMTFHRAKIPYQSKTSHLDAETTSWLQGGAGGNEEIFVTVPESGYYCLAVWRADNGNAGEGFYALEFDTATGVETTPLLPKRTALSSVHPNPFNPRTTIAFDLAQETPTIVQVYDLRGAHVRTLVHETLAAGRHEVTWSGIDARGQRVSSGTYFVQLWAGSVRETRKVSLVK